MDRVSYMSAPVLLNLLNELSKSDKMQGLLSILSLFHNKFNKFNKSGACILDSIYHVTLELFCKHLFGVITSIFLEIYATLLWTSFHNVAKISKPLVVYPF